MKRRAVSPEFERRGDVWRPQRYFIGNRCNNRAATRRNYSRFLYMLDRLRDRKIRTEALSRISRVADVLLKSQLPGMDIYRMRFDACASINLANERNEYNLVNVIVVTNIECSTFLEYHFLREKLLPFHAMPYAIVLLRFGPKIIGILFRL